MQVCVHPSFRVLSLRVSPQVPAALLKFTTYSWNAVLKRLLQMFITQSGASERLDWSVKVGSPSVAQGLRGKSNKASGSYVVLRGTLAAQADVSALADPALAPGWMIDPLLAAASPYAFRGHEMLVTLLSADQVSSSSGLLSHTSQYAMLLKLGCPLRTSQFVHQ